MFEIFVVEGWQVMPWKTEGESFSQQSFGQVLGPCTVSNAEIIVYPVFFSLYNRCLSRMPFENGLAISGLSIRYDWYPKKAVIRSCKYPFGLKSIGIIWCVMYYALCHLWHTIEKSKRHMQEKILDAM